MAVSVGDDLLGLGSLLALVVASLAAVAVLSRLDDEWPAVLRRRLVLGVPWGALASIALVACVYLFVQGGWRSLSNPLVLPFHSWSYTNVLGMVTSSFAHADLSHVTGNVLGTLAFGVAAEYAWSHYPTERGNQSFATTWTNPYARIGVFVAGVVGVGLAAGLLVPGPNVGFSVLVYAFAGFAIIVAPLAAIVAMLGEGVFYRLYNAAVEPVSVHTAELQYAEPWFAGISVQGHAFGVVAGMLLGLFVVYRRRDFPPVRYVWFAVLVYAVSKQLWTLYWYDGATTFLLFRGVGLALVFGLVVVVAGTFAVSETRPIPRSDLTWGHLAALALVAVVLGFGIAAVPYNLVDVEDPDADAGLDVRDYTVYYAEDVTHGYAQAVELPLGLTSVTDRAGASGVIAVSDRRDVWREAVPAGRLAADGSGTVTVGGLTWRETVSANRTGWNAIDAADTYKVYLRRDDEPRRLAYAADPVRLAPRVGGYNLSIAPAGAGYVLNATRNGSVAGRGRVPARNESVEIGDVRITRRDGELYASHDGTRVRVAEYRQTGRER